MLMYQYKKELIPYYASGWEKKYIKMSEMDRIINIIYNLVKKSEFEYKKFKNKKILRVKYENILDNPLIL